ncbi:outer membrane protein assembly factor BamB family protein [Actinomycetospora soli]|uniref:outer membrane protein assembly factor BamB family protein n=1 Tax=Actinomycetospora soli TaxID=2893887 RepID=UPI001E34C6C7|nr:PQQ-binding-like beta-propeller repeat protein [Actinomycetospora soli]MCD2187572.1 PQQ-like beta-propeller repeat protein [Actinomycetospora soli]
MTRALLVVGLVAALVGTATVVAPREEPDLPSSLAVVTAAVLAAAVALAWTGGRGRAAAVVAASGVLAAVGTGVAAVASGWPGPGPVVLVAGTLLVLVAPALRRMRARVAAVVAAVLVLGAAGAAAVAAPVLGTLPLSAPEVPAALDPAGARWRLPLGEVRAAVVAGPGLVLATAPDGRSATALVGVDTATGRVVWGHARTNAAADQVVAAPDGRTVALLARLRDGGRPDDDRVLTVLDAVSGRPAWSALVRGRTLRVADGVVAVTAPDGHLEARALETGEPVWRAGPAPRCAFAPVGAAGTVGVLPVVQDCPGPLGGPRRVRALVGLAADSGRPVWVGPSTPQSDDGVDGLRALPVTAGGRFVASDTGATLLDVREGRPVTAAGPGEVLREDGVGIVVVRSTPGGSVRVAVVDPTTGTVVPAPPCPTPRSASPTLVAGRPVVLCALPEGPWELRGPDGAPVRRIAPGTTTDELLLVATLGGLVAVPDALRAGPVVGM